MNNSGESTHNASTFKASIDKTEILSLTATKIIFLVKTKLKARLRFKILILYTFKKIAFLYGAGKLLKLNKEKVSGNSK